MTPGIELLSEPVRHNDTSQHLLLAAVTGALGTAVMLFDREDKLVFVSDEFRRYFPLPEKVLVPGARLRDILGAVYDAGYRFGMRPDQSVNISRDDWIADRIAIHWRERHEGIEQLKDGRWVKLTKRRLPNGILINAVSDVSDQKQRDRDYREMRDQAELAQHILDILPNPVIVKDSQLRYVLVNNAFCELLGVPAREILGRRAAELVGPVAGAEFEESERKVLKTGEPIEFVEDIPNQDGTISRAITRKHRSGSSGAYYVTISVDRIVTYANEKKSASDAGNAAKPKTRTRKRVLIVDEIAARAEARVAELLSEGCDAMAVGDHKQLMAFLETAHSMDIAVDDIEVSEEMRNALARNPFTAKFPELERFAGARDSEAQQAAPVEASQSAGQVQSGPDEADAHDTATTGQAATPPVNARAGPVARNTETSAKRHARAVVLVAEDNEVNQIVFQQILDGMDVEYSIVDNGEQAVAAWRDQRPDLILMDVSMPVMNGHQATREIRAEEDRDGADATHVPIIAVTAHALAGDSDECFAAGMDDYLTKPISPDKLVQTISTWLPGAAQKAKSA